jgi:hypothetical protein
LTKIASESTEKQSSKDELRDATERAERAEAELARLKAQSSPGTREAADETSTAQTLHIEDAPAENDGIAELRKDSMMTHLLDSLEAGKDIGHCGRLVFAMVARHFLSDEEVLTWLGRDRDFGEAEAVAMLRQVEGRDYNPPKRERILAWQAEQEFPILPNPEDPDCGNLYRNLKFPNSIYKHIEHYQEQKADAAS